MSMNMMKNSYKDPKWNVTIYAPDYEDDIAIETSVEYFTNYVTGKALYEWLKDIYEGGSDEE